MSGLSKVIVLDPDARAGRQVQLGFEREGVPTAIAPVPLDAGKLELFPAGEDVSLVVVGGTSEARALDLIKRARVLLDAAHIDAPIVFAGRGVRRTDAEAAGADEVVLQPAHLRDVVTIGRLLRGQPATQRVHLVGNLAETTGVFTLVRALSALGRSAVLTLIRGLRRGEVRFYHGEVTSAQVGLIHGQAALHQLLLWTDARFDLQHEDVVRRQQIPMAHDELFADAERFLSIVRDESGPLSPSMVLEQDVARIHSLGKQIPTEVHGVLRMFDGHRVMADVLEDSPYRVFETLRVTQRALDAGLLRQASTPRPKATWRAVLAIEEWLVGGARDEMERAASESGPLKASDVTGPRVKEKSSRRTNKRKKRRASTPVAMPAITTRPDIDWGALVPRIVGAEVGQLAGVVPASHASGEIMLPTREEPREKLEALMDTDKRERIFPHDIGLEPKVVWDEFEGEQAAPAAADGASSESANDLARRLAAARTTTDTDKSGERRARSSAEGDAESDKSGERRARSSAEGDAESIDKARIGADARAAAELTARSEDESRAAVEAKAAADLAAGERAEAEARAAVAKAEAEAAEQAAAKQAAAERVAAEKAASEKAAADRAAAETAAAAADKAAAERVAAEKAAADKAAADRKAAAEA
ncbi:MAG: DUF4388 domain-containing protein, partial [Kofleriaceae bacterium]